MDRLQAKTPVRRWLVLGLAVLLAHLGLLQSMPLALNPGGSLADPAVTFATRAIAPLPELAPAPVMPTAVVKAKLKSPAPRKAAIEPQSPAPDNLGANPQQPGTATTGFGGESDLLAATSAATPIPAPEPPATKEPAAAPRPPRESWPRTLESPD